MATIPGLYETEHTPLQDKIIHLHFFIGGCDWYIAEHDGGDLLWGYAILNGDYQMAEWGYISFRELRDISVGGLEIDCELEEYFKPKRAAEIDKICKGMMWPLPGKEVQSAESYEISNPEGINESDAESSKVQSSA